ncbi:MAG: carbohydrate ABC transporter permease [Clostridia bacterium]|uniref:carbohydrate ABC transporter permease n=1 Tax=Pumilibacter muris TaxID=2941510 RepID=UPI00203B9DFE|nr:carbohydrate ABC transporter permease [Pumilibacter muris]MCI8596351.1 carbohydrate ABC transporter permease [Clostridia bacterium]
MTGIRNKRTLIAQIALAAVLLILCFLVLFPFWLMLVKSFKSFMQEVENPLSLTFPLNFKNYAVAWEHISGSIFNSFFVSISEALITLVLSSIGAYAFARYKFRFKNVIYSAFLALMMIPGVLTLTTRYVMVASSFALYGSYLGVILPQAASLVPFGILLLRGFFDGIPRDLFDAADIDGANSVKQFVKIALPLSLPILLTLVLMNFMTSWNDYLWPMIMLGNQTDKYTIPVMLNSFTLDYYKTELYYAAPLAGSVIVSVPILVLFAFTSKQFIRGMTSGAFKM